MNTISPIDLKKAAQKIPPSPRIFGKLGKMLKDPNTGLDNITELVNADSSLTAQVLRLSNSAMFSMGCSVDTLDEAINRIGFRELFRLVGMAASQKAFSDYNRIYDIPGTDLWENSLTCGIAMEILARKLGYDDQEAYTIGLLRNMGKMVIDFCLQGDTTSPVYNKTSALPLIEWEEANFGITNPSVAGFILVSWNFTEETCHTITYQYEPDKAPRKLPLITLLNVANGIAERLGKGIRGESPYWEYWEENLPKTGLNLNEIAEAEDEIADAVSKVVSSLG